MNRIIRSNGEIADGDEVEVEVVRVIPTGLKVRTLNGLRGFIPNRELLVSRRIGRDKISFSPGQIILAVVVNSSNSEIQLTLKRYSEDAWRLIANGGYKIGDVVHGEVVNIVEYGAFVELDLGIDVLLHRRHIPISSDKQISESIWIGDYLELTILDISLTDKRMEVSISEHLKQLVIKRDRPDNQIVIPVTPLLPDRNNESISSKHYRKFNKIVVADLEEDVELVKWISNLGYEVSRVKNLISLLSISIEETIFIIDLAFLLEYSLDLVDLQIYFDKGCVIFSLQPNQAEDVNLFPSLRVQEILFKPLRYVEVVETLAAVENNTSNTLRTYNVFQRKPNTTEIFNSQSGVITLSTTLLEIITKLEDNIKATDIIVIGMNRFKQRATVITHNNTNNTEIISRNREGLHFTAVKDVILNRKGVHTGNAIHSGEMSSLLQLFYFESIIGEPIPHTIGEMGYGLFVFSDTVNAFTDQQISMVHSVATLIGSALWNDEITKLLSKSQNFLVTGQIVSSISHEIKNRLVSIRQITEKLQKDSELFQNNSNIPNTVPPKWAERIAGRAHDLAEIHMELKTLVDEYLQPSSISKISSIDLNSIITQVADQMRIVANDESSANRILIKLNLAITLPRIVSASGKLKQILTNLILNSIQQIRSMKTGFRIVREVTIQSWYAASDTRFPVKVLIIDTGPGIHRLQWSWVFEFGTSTRDDGSGIGLFVVKELVNSLGGRVTIEGSYIFIGTKILIELPLQTAI